MKHRQSHSKRKKGGAALPVASARGSGKENAYHRRRKTQAAVVRPMSPTTAQAYALLRLAEQYTRLKAFADDFWAQHIEVRDSVSLLPSSFSFSF
jgi:hypothetical protein